MTTTLHDSIGFSENVRRGKFEIPDTLIVCDVQLLHGRSGAGGDAVNSRNRDS